MPESFERGALTEAVFYILLSLHKPMHGYAIMQNIEALTKGRVALGPGTLYGAINALVEKRWIKAVYPKGDPQKNNLQKSNPQKGNPQKSETRKKEYVITEAGRTVFMGELDRLDELIRNGEKAITPSI
ncbi:MAG: PadR family transcriptional regulator [Clostridiales bacterium]|nr:PadR family transcriptional regulator [Clostridiales bacterium]